MTMDDAIHIGIFAHAANGGVRIAPDASTGVSGLFAAGEVTGGMHGADRIGGLSTANGLVFGGIAGRSAALYCEEIPEPPQTVEFTATAALGCQEALSELRTVMSREGMVVRSEQGLKNALDTVYELRERLEEHPSENGAEIARSRRMNGQLCTAECVLQAALLRKESRGSHCRSDYPEENAELVKQIMIRKTENGLDAQFDRRQEGCRSQKKN